MKRIQVLGPGCTNCRSLYERAHEAARQLGLEVEIEKITDFEAIARAGVMSTPALLVDGKLMVSGRVPPTEELMALLSGPRSGGPAHAAGD
jgi:small redox-active disulfide protein 2